MFGQYAKIMAAAHTVAARIQLAVFSLVTGLIIAMIPDVPKASAASVSSNDAFALATMMASPVSSTGVDHPEMVILMMFALFAMSAIALAFGKSLLNDIQAAGRSRI